MTTASPRLNTVPERSVANGEPWVPTSAGIVGSAAMLAESFPSRTNVASCAPVRSRIARWRATASRGTSRAAVMLRMMRSRVSDCGASAAEMELVMVSPDRSQIRRCDSVSASSPALLPSPCTVLIPYGLACLSSPTCSGLAVRSRPSFSRKAACRSISVRMPNPSCLSASLTRPTASLNANGRSTSKLRFCDIAHPSFATVAAIDLHVNDANVSSDPYRRCRPIDLSPNAPTKSIDERPVSVTSATTALCVSSFYVGPMLLEVALRCVVRSKRQPTDRTPTAMAAARCLPSGTETLNVSATTSRYSITTRLSALAHPEHSRPAQRVDCERRQRQSLGKHEDLISGDQHDERQSSSLRLSQRLPLPPVGREACQRQEE